MAADLEVKQITSESFSQYAKVITGIDVTEILKRMEETPMADGVIYAPSDAGLESTKEAVLVRDNLFGGMPIQIGFCNGHNHRLNAVEYHRDSEINIAATDLIMIWGKQTDMTDDFTYDTAQMEAFLIPRGTVVECYATTLHYAPCSVGNNAFRCVVVLPKGTNTEKPDVAIHTKEDKLLFARNKWLVAHPESGLSKEGAFEGLIGKNLTV